MLTLQSTCFICTTCKRKQTMEQQPHCACERTKSKQKQNQVTSLSNWPRVILFDLAHKLIKGWLHCLLSESKGRFVVNNILMFDSTWWLVIAQIQSSLIKKKNIGRPELSLTPHPLRPIASHFCLIPPPLPQSGHHMRITPDYIISIKVVCYLQFLKNKISSNSTNHL